MRSLIIALLLCACCALAALNAAEIPTCPWPDPYMPAAPDAPGSQVALPPYPDVPRSLDEVDIGDTATIGTTWYDMQHNSSVGRSIAKGSDQYFHYVWTNSLDMGSMSRHVYYNAMDANGMQLWPGTGYSVESMVMCGYATLDVAYDERAVPAFHGRETGAAEVIQIFITVDYFPHAGAFMPYSPDPPHWHGELVNAGWPKIQIGNEGTMHIVSSSPDYPDGRIRHFYTRATYDEGAFEVEFPDVMPHSYRYIGESDVFGAEVAASDVSNRVAIAWLDPHHDIQLLIDDDGQNLDFAEAFNLTNWIPPDFTWLPDTLLANMDTLRCHNDISLFFDSNDYLHAAFTTRAYFALEGVTYWNASLIWHWSEELPNDFKLIANAFDPGNWIDCGANNVRVQRPSLGQSSVNGYLYCAYQQFDVDSLHLSAGGYPSGEVYISVSMDGGQNWSVGTNVTETITPQSAPPGMSQSECYPCLAKAVDSECHLAYLFDRDAGCAIFSEGSITLNPMKAHDVPVNLIPTTPLLPQDVPFHVEHAWWPLAANSSPGEGEQMHLQAAPNPFNPTTTISFSLPEAAYVELAVYNLSGRKVATLAEGMQSAGSHAAVFDGSSLSSGIYLYRLSSSGIAANGKMLLVK